MATLGGIKDSSASSQNSLELDCLAHFAVDEHNKKESQHSTFCYRSYAGVFSRLQNLVDILRNVHLDVSLPQKDALIQKTFVSIQTIKQVFFSMSQNLKEQNKAVLSRLFAHITSQKPPLFSSEQMAEIQVILPSLGSVFMSPSVANTVMGE
ncbi:hypothetical protein POM88_021362 [Heracleum sosnowskyi]|uniref:CPL3 ARM repeat domain-containing protein n=1 Tax=Heracleum sosnowskyi TaxID=360622 RepID=A0AAD8MSQ2_9APIA|nr:hypothetical protein POM88_021362 [Heracleum sosnowskyi]